MTEGPIDQPVRPAASSPLVEVLFEDNHLLALNKPAGMLTQDSGRSEDSAEARARRYIKESRHKAGAVFLHVVHRLDRDVSGIVLCATTSKALARLNEQTRQRSLRKLYHAIVTAPPTGRTDVLAEQGELVHWLCHDRFRARVAAPESKNAHECRLRYRVLARYERSMLVEVELETGRYHQIRAQMAAAGCPIVGDRRYGGRPRTATGIALHHVRLELEHPVRREPLVIEAPYPTEWPQDASG